MSTTRVLLNTLGPAYIGNAAGFIAVCSISGAILGGTMGLGFGVGLALKNIGKVSKKGEGAGAVKKARIFVETIVETGAQWALNGAMLGGAPVTYPLSKLN